MCWVKITWHCNIINFVIWHNSHSTRLDYLSTCLLLLITSLLAIAMWLLRYARYCIYYDTVPPCIGLMSIIMFTIMRPIACFMVVSKETILYGLENSYWSITSVDIDKLIWCHNILILPFKHCTAFVSGIHCPLSMHTLMFGPVKVCPKEQPKMAVVPSVMGSLMPMTLIVLVWSDNRGWLHGLAVT